MQKLILFLFLILAAKSSDAQPIKPEAKVLEQLISHYNNNRFAELYDMLSADFKKASSLEDYSTFYKQNLKVPNGNIQGWKYTDTAQKGNNFIVDFERGRLLLSLYLAKDQSISGISWKPYTEKRNIKQPRSAALIKSNNPKSSKLDRFIDSLATTYLSNPHNHSISIGLINKGKKVSYFYGDRSAEKTPDEHSLYEIASITKTFTGALLANAVIEGKVSLNDDIRKYLPGKYPNLERNGKTVRLVDLANHTSGIPGLPADFDKIPGYTAADPYKGYTKDMIYRFLAGVTLNADPGKEAVYSNLSFAVLGSILEKVYGRPLAELNQRLITAPLKMSETFFSVPMIQGNLLMKGHDVESGQVAPYWDMAAFNAAGGLKSNVKDMLTYLQANLDKTNKAFQLSHQPTDKQSDFSRGLAWMISPVAGQQVFWHNGGTAGFRTFCGFNKELQTAIVVLSNSNEGVDDIALQILSAMR